MTAWERAMGLIAELTSLDTGYDCCLTGESAINVIRTALADAERGGMLRAANILDKYAALCDETTKSFRKTTLRVMADQLKASADDGQVNPPTE